MNAMISGRAGVAILFDGNSVTSIQYEALDQPVSRSRDEIDVLLRGVSDVAYVEDVNLQAVQDSLEDAVDSTEGLDLVLFLLDPHLSDDTRRTAAWELDELSSDNFIVEFLQDTFWASPLPISADLEGAIRCCEAAEAPATLRFLKELAADQSAIHTVRQEWRSAVDEISVSELSRKTAEAACLQSGLFRDFVESSRTGVFDDVLVSGITNPRLNESLGSGTTRRLLVGWKNQLAATAPAAKKTTRTAKLRPQEREDHEIPGPKRHPDYNREEAKENVDIQKAYIVQRMQNGDLYRVRHLVEELIASQLRHHDGHKFVCKSLCDLAVQAQEFGHFPLQLELTERAVQIVPDDAWSWTQHGKSLLNNGQSAAALAAYDRALQFGADTIAKTGRAEVLKSLGRLDDALQAYDDVRREHPEDVFAKNGRAEVLKSLGRLDDALQAYDDVRREHPENAVAKTGRAEVLKSLGRLDDALRAYDDVRREHPEDVVAKNGRAELLKSLGRLDDALRAYDDVRREHPEDVFAKNGRAEVLKSLGRLDDALRAYDDVRREHPEDVFAKNGRAEVLKSLGRLDDALRAYDDVRREHPEDVIAKAGRAEVLKSLGRLDDALRAYDDVRREHPENVVAKTGRAEVLKSLGRLDDALQAYDDVRREHPENVVAKTGRAELLKSLGRLDDALQAYDDVRREHPENVVAKTGRAELLKSLGRLDDALRAYDDVRREHPENAVAKTGRAALLVAMGKWDLAIKELPEKDPKSLNDWIGFHIRGMIELRAGNLESAMQIFTRGVESCPFAASRDYFRTALSIAQLRLRDFGGADQTLGRIESPALRDRARLLDVHALCGLRRFSEARKALEGVPASESPIERELVTALGRRVAAGRSELADNDQLVDLEIRYLLLAA